MIWWAMGMNAHSEFGRFLITTRLREALFGKKISVWMKMQWTDMSRRGRIIIADALTGRNNHSTRNFTWPLRVRLYSFYWPDPFEYLSPFCDCFTNNLVVMSDSEFDSSRVGYEGVISVKKRKNRYSEWSDEKITCKHSWDGSKHFKCFQIIGSDERQKVLWYFSKLEGYNTQNKYLAGLIMCTCCSEMQSKARQWGKSPPFFLLLQSKYWWFYEICTSMLHGITARPFQTLKQNLVDIGNAEPDGHG